MNKIIPILLIVICLFTNISCNKKMMKEKPKDLIPWDTMVVVLADGCITESALFFAPRQYDKQILSRYAYQELFERHHITREQYVNSMGYYFSNEESGKKMLDEVELKVNEWADQLPPDTAHREPPTFKNY